MLSRSNDRIAGTCVLVITILLTTQTETLCAQSIRNDGLALNELFGDEHLAANALGVCVRAAKLPADERYDFLANWVLPGESHATIRVVADFSPTHGAPMPGQSEATTGGEIVSPALDLIGSAESLDRLDELRQRVAAATTGNRIDQFALLALIGMADGDATSALSNLTELFALVLPEGEVAPIANDAVLLCVHAAADHPDLSLAIVDAAYRVVQSYQAVHQRTAWQRQFSAAYARVDQAADIEGDTAPPGNAAADLEQWFPSGPPRARYRGPGAPVARWATTTGEANNLFSHDEDFLYFSVPLRGNFEVECDVTGFGWLDSQLLFAGKWVGPVYNHVSYEVGDIGGAVARFDLNPPMTRVGRYIHYRIVVRDGVATTYFNGRPIHAQPLSADHDPWLAVRSAVRYDGGVRDLRITGDPVVPVELRLSGAPDMVGWIPYFDDVVGIDWWYHEGNDEIHAFRNSQCPRGSARESALFYHRPMVEDGSIEYEFWYESGACEAHPVLDRLCFLIGPEGVNLHWLTDGAYDRTYLAPDNLTEEPANRRGNGPFPLREADWNRVQLTVRADTVDLVLNGEPVYERRIEPTNQRHFGLFHFADQTELRVRNVIWKGDWPREAPELADQKLAIDETGFLDERLPELTAMFSHDFAQGGFPLEQFTVIRGDPSRPVASREDGLYVSRQAEGGYRDTTVAPSLAVGGDFDITASFDQLAFDPRAPGSCNIFLQVIADNETAEEAILLRRQAIVDGRDDHFLQCARVSRPNGQDRRRYFDRLATEALGGTLRLSRRGDRIYCLFAENDSQQFRLIGEEDYTSDDLLMQGVRLVAQIHGENGSTGVVWKDLTIRAERRSGPAFELRETLAELNRARSVLPASFMQDFTSTPPHDALIRRWTDRREWDSADDGLLIVAPGTETGTSAGAALQRRIEGDFDAAIRFDPQLLATPDEGRTTAFYLQMEFADPGSTQLSLVVQKAAQGATEVIAQRSVANDESVRSYSRLGRVVGRAQGLRLARRGRTITGTFFSEDSGNESIVFQADVGDAPVNPDCTRLMLRSGGAGRESRIIWKSIELRADHIGE